MYYNFIIYVPVWFIYFTPHVHTYIYTQSYYNTELMQKKLFALVLSRACMDWSERLQFPVQVPIDYRGLESSRRAGAED